MAHTFVIKQEILGRRRARTNILFTLGNTPDNVWKAAPCALRFPTARKTEIIRTLGRDLIPLVLLRCLSLGRLYFIGRWLQLFELAQKVRKIIDSLSFVAQLRQPVLGHLLGVRFHG